MMLVNMPSVILKLLLIHSNRKMNLDHRIGMCCFDGERGFGGKCLPKDTSHFAHVMSKHFSPPNFLNFVLKDNELTR